MGRRMPFSSEFSDDRIGTARPAVQTIRYPLGVRCGSLIGENGTGDLMVRRAGCGGGAVRWAYGLSVTAMPQADLPVSVLSRLCI